MTTHDDRTGYNDPQYRDPQTVDPQYQDPQTVDPQYGDAQYRDPQTIDPQYGDPQTVDPQFQQPVDTTPADATRVETVPTQHLPVDDTRADAPLATDTTPAAPVTPAGPATPAAHAAGAGDGLSLFGETEMSGFRARWNDVQTAFVDDPKDCVQKADALVSEVVDQLTTGFADARSRMEAQWARGEETSTEDLRVALQNYREFFQRLLAV